MVITTADGSQTIRHHSHGEPYHSLHGAAIEARSLYIESSRFLEALQGASTRLGVLDVGLGLGYNAMSTIDAWLAAPNPPSLDICSVECDASLLDALLSQKGAWQNCWPKSWLEQVGKLRRTGAGCWLLTMPHPLGQAVLTWSIHLGDVLSQEGLPDAFMFDFVWNDPFSPANNPDLWTSEWFSRVADRCASGAILMSYSVARSVRESLTEAGWEWEKIPTTTHKRAWLRARLSRDLSARISTI